MIINKVMNKLHVTCTMIMYLIFNLLHNTKGMESEVVLLPHDTSFICPGEKVLFTCTTNATFLTWNVTIPFVEHTIDHSRTLYYTTSAAVIAMTPIRVLNVTFNASKLSIGEILPFIMTLSVINPVNGTKVWCYANNNISSQMVSTVHVIKSGADDVIPRAPRLLVRETFRANSITVILEWKEEVGMKYTASIFPEASLIFTGSATLQLRLSYNNDYNVSIMATLCQQNSVNTTINLSYGKCLGTFDEVLVHSAHANGDTYLEGTNITFTCSPGLVLSGPNSSTCTRNGEWEPSPKEVECKVDCGVPRVKNDVLLIFNTTLEGSQLIFWCDQSPNDTKTASCLSDGRWNVVLDDYSCTGHGNLLLPLMLVVGITLLLIPFIIVLIVVTVIMRRKGMCARKLQMDTAIQDYAVTSHQQSQHILSRSEYSLVQYSPTEELPLDSNKAAGLRKNYLVYADIGPRSFEKQTCTSTIDIQSYKVEYAQLNHGAQVKVNPPKLELSNQEDTAGPDTLLNLDSLLIQLRSEVTPKWYQFGEIIGIEKKVLDKYQQYSPEQSLIEILDNWLRNHVGQPTWREITEALRKIDLHKLAFDIERVYDTGKLPIEVDMNRIPQIDSAEELPPPIPPRLL